jgi:hypothetical protein
MKPIMNQFPSPEEFLSHAKRTEPSIPWDDPRFVWTPGADVQATWRRFGWVPPSELKATKEG